MSSFTEYLKSLFLGKLNEVESSAMDLNNKVSQMLLLTSTEAKKLAEQGNFDAKEKDEVTGKLMFISERAVRMIEEQNFDANLEKQLREELIQTFSRSMADVVPPIVNECGGDQKHFDLELNRYYSRPWTKIIDHVAKPKAAVCNITVVRSSGAKSFFEFPEVASIMEVKMCIAKKVKYHPITHITLKLGDTELKKGTLVANNVTEGSVLNVIFNTY